MTEVRENPDVIENELEQTRARLSENLNELSDRMSPGHLLDQALQYFDGGPKEFANVMGDQVRRNPMATVLTGVGLAWLAMGNDKAKTRQFYKERFSEAEEESGFGDWASRVDDDDPYRSTSTVEGYLNRMKSYLPDFDSDDDDDRRERSDRDYGFFSNAEAEDQYRRRFETYRPAIETQDRLRTVRRSTVRTEGEADHDYYRRLDDGYADALSISRNEGESDASYNARIRAAYDTATDKASAARESLGQSLREARATARDRMQQGGEAARHYARRSKRGAEEFYDENPLASGAIAVAVGALAGSLFKPTQSEREALEPLARDLAERGTAMAEELSERGAAHAETFADRAAGMAEQAATKVEQASQQVQDETTRAEEKARTRVG